MPFNLIQFFSQQLLLDALLIGLPFAYCAFYKKNPWKEFRLERIPFKQLLNQGAMAFAAIFITSFVIIAVASALHTNDLQPVGKTILFLLAQSPIALAYLLSIRVIAEELFFRSFLVPRVGILASTIAFAAAHVLYGSALQVIGAFVLGLILAYYFRKNNSVYPNIVAHALYNMSALILLY